MSTIVLILFFAPTMRSIGIPWKEKKIWLSSNLTVCQKALMLKGTKPKGTNLKKAIIENWKFMLLATTKQQNQQKSSYILNDISIVVWIC